MLPLSQTIWIPRWPVKITQREEAFRSHRVDSWGQNIIVLSSWLLTECSLNCTAPAWRLSTFQAQPVPASSSPSLPAQRRLWVSSGERNIHLQTKACPYLLNIHSEKKTILQTTVTVSITHRRVLVWKSSAACVFLQHWTSCPGTQARLLSFKSKPMIQGSQGEQEKPTWLLCRLQGSAERPLFTRQM